MDASKQIWPPDSNELKFPRSQSPEGDETGSLSEDDTENLLTRQYFESARRLAKLKGQLIDLRLDMADETSKRELLRDQGGEPDVPDIDFENAQSTRYRNESREFKANMATAERLKSECIDEGVDVDRLRWKDDNLTDHANAAEQAYSASIGVSGFHGRIQTHHYWQDRPIRCSDVDADGVPYDRSYGPTEEITDPDLRQAFGATAYALVRGINHSEPYDDSYQTQTSPENFFVPGKIFSLLWADASEVDSDGGSEIARDRRYQQPIRSKVRRFIVIHSSTTYCSALPMVTSDIDIMSSRVRIETCRPIDSTMQGSDAALTAGPIRVAPDLPRNKVNPRAQLDLSRVYTLELCVKVKSWGKVTMPSLHRLRSYFRDFWHGKSAPGPSTTPNESHRIPKGRDSVPRDSNINGWREANTTMTLAGSRNTGYSSHPLLDFEYLAVGNPQLAYSGLMGWPARPASVASSPTPTSVEVKIMPVLGSVYDANGVRVVSAINPATHVRTIIGTSPPQRITDPELFRAGIHARRMLYGSEGLGERLYSEFRKRDDPHSYFTVGRVFAVLWTEPAGETTTLVTHRIKNDRTYDDTVGATASLSTAVYSKVRRFVVVRESREYCSALPIVSYGRMGLGKAGVVKFEHGIIHTGVHPPLAMVSESPRQGELGMQGIPVRVSPGSPVDKLDQECRVDYGKVHTIHHNIKVKPFGTVRAGSVGALLQQCGAVWQAPRFFGAIGGTTMDQRLLVEKQHDSQVRESLHDLSSGEDLGLEQGCKIPASLTNTSSIDPAHGAQIAQNALGSSHSDGLRTLVVGRRDGLYTTHLSQASPVAEIEDWVATQRAASERLRTLPADSRYMDINRGNGVAAMSSSVNTQDNLPTRSRVVGNSSNALTQQTGRSAGRSSTLEEKAGSQNYTCSTKDMGVRLPPLSAAYNTEHHTRQQILRGPATASDRRGPGTPDGPHRSLDPAFKMRRDPKRFFVVGKVFRGIWSEQAEFRGSAGSSASEGWSQDSFGLWIFTKMRLFVVVDASERSCTALAITSYNGQGVDKAGVNASDHCMVHTGRTVPTAPEAFGNMMQPNPIWVDQDSIDKLDPMSRLDLRKPYTLPHTLKVKPFGKVNKASMVHLQTQYRNVQFGKHSMSTETDVRPPVSLLTNQPSTFANGDHRDLAARALRTLIAAGWSTELALRVVQEPYTQETNAQIEPPQ
ncbi:hypothetical protein LTR56_014343 [Elasticomyces elasticus]|nr:hypothetical protein LTR56_014343 [Elasticomyces elasticus]KAK4916599.1 hypothetical protein LTR49_015432 [Elasticomyces elasticus]